MIPLTIIGLQPSAEDMTTKFADRVRGLFHELSTERLRELPEECDQYAERYDSDAVRLPHAARRSRIKRLIALEILRERGEQVDSLRTVWVVSLLSAGTN